MTDLNPSQNLDNSDPELVMLQKSKYQKKFKSRGFDLQSKKSFFSSSTQHDSINTLNNEFEYLNSSNENAYYDETSFNDFYKESLVQDIFDNKDKKNKEALEVGSSIDLADETKTMLKETEVDISELQSLENISSTEEEHLLKDIIEKEKQNLEKDFNIINLDELLANFEELNPVLYHNILNNNSELKNFIETMDVSFLVDKDANLEEADILQLLAGQGLIDKDFINISLLNDLIEKENLKFIKSIVYGSNASVAKLDRVMSNSLYDKNPGLDNINSLYDTVNKVFPDKDAIYRMKAFALSIAYIQRRLSTKMDLKTAKLSSPDSTLDILDRKAVLNKKKKVKTKKTGQAKNKNYNRGSKKMKNEPINETFSLAEIGLSIDEVLTNVVSKDFVFSEHNQFTDLGTQEAIINLQKIK